MPTFDVSSISSDDGSSQDDLSFRTAEKSEEPEPTTMGDVLRSTEEIMNEEELSLME